jgi:hypothetical protein
MGEGNCQEFFKKGHLNEAGVSFYVDRMLFGEVNLIPDILLEHVENCQNCKSEVLELFEICNNNPGFKTDINASSQKPRKTIFNNKLSILWRIAASIIIISSLTFFIVLIIEKNGTQNGIAANKEIKDSILVTENKVSQSTSTKNDIASNIGNNPEYKGHSHILVNQNSKHEFKYIASDYAVDPDLESLIEEKFRSELSLKIISPKREQELSINSLILFHWEGKSNEKLMIEIFNNKAEKIEEIKNINNNNKVMLKKRLLPGLYYWKLETADELVYLGEFIIK